MANKEAEPVYISFARLDNLLSVRGMRWQALRDIGISPGIVQKMQRGTGHVDTRTIQRVCALLHCQPGEIMEYCPPGRTGPDRSDGKTDGPALTDRTARQTDRP